MPGQCCVDDAEGRTVQSHALEPLELITLAGGCFWCLEAVFLDVEGVRQVEPGYSNGHVESPTYESVCTGQTGHAEVVRVGFDPAVISLEEILQIFFLVHDPTTVNRQGHDVGTQYRSGIYTHSAEQAARVQAMVDGVRAAGLYPAPLVTELAAERLYHPAESYHHRYFERHPEQGYCAFVVAPKVEKFRRTFAARVRRR